MHRPSIISKCIEVFLRWTVRSVAGPKFAGKYDKYNLSYNTKQKVTSVSEVSKNLFQYCPLSLYTPKGTEEVSCGPSHPAQFGHIFLYSLNAQPTTHT